MIFWVDAQLPPQLAHWLRSDHGLEAFAVRELGLRDAEDAEIFAAARAIGAVVISKDSDFVALVEKFGVPPQLLWVTCGNVSNRRLRSVFATVLSAAVRLLADGSEVVEVADER